jgi:hypothetical protein
MEMILPIVCGILILLGLIAVVMSRDTWPIYQMILVAFVLLANVAFLYLAARTLYTHREWRNEVKKYEAAYAQQNDIHKRLTGEMDGLSDYEVDRNQKPVADWSLDDWKAEAAKVFYGRGRVLIGVVPARFDAMTGMIGGAVNQPDPIAIPKDTSVHVFEFGTRQQAGRYLGPYLVSNVNGQAIDLSPLFAEQKTPPASPLVIYEIAPIDSHAAFNDEHVIRTLRAQIPPPVTDQETLVMMRERVLRTVLPPEVVLAYLKDGMPADPNDPPERVWRLVQFKKPFPTEEPAAPVAAAPQQPADEPAVDAEIATDEPAAPRVRRFRPGDTALFDPETAKDLVEVKMVADYAASKPEEGIYSHVYMRRLNDYPTAFRDIRSQLLATNLKRNELDRQLQEIQNSIQLASQTAQIRQQEAAKLTSDLQKFTAETEIVQKHHDALDEQLKALRAQVEGLKQSIQSRANELARLQLQAAERMNRLSPVGATAR